MFLHVLVIFFTFALICTAAPTLEKEHCGKPGQIEGATLQGVWNAESYSPGSVARFTCLHGYIKDGPIRMACIEGSWLDISRGQCKNIAQSCGAPPVVQFGDITDSKRLTYPLGSSVKYKCSNFYKPEGKDTITCQDGQWEKEPICRAPCTTRGSDMEQNNIRLKWKEDEKLVSEHTDYISFECIPGYKISAGNSLRTQCLDGVLKFPKCYKEDSAQSCGAPPVIQNGDITDVIRLSYPSESSVKYKCVNYYKLEGKETITCRNGEWEKEPICRVPCTVREIDLKRNNIRLKYREDSKLYSEHGDYISFVCIPGYKLSDETRLRLQCLDGVIKYPKCLKEGFCVLQQKEMSFNNIQYNKSIDIENGQTIEFECVEGAVTKNNLKGTCINKQINYPKCSPGWPCLPPKMSNALVSPEKKSYASGSSIYIKCEDTYVLNGHTNVKCRNSQWDELPQCYKPCTISAEILDKNHIEIKSWENSSKTLEHGMEVNVKCKTNFRRPGTLTAFCYDGIMNYPRCFSGGICRINQLNLDDNYLELDERHEDEVFYGEGEIVHFKCKVGYSSSTGLTGRCTKSITMAGYELTYPICA